MKKEKELSAEEFRKLMSDLASDFQRAAQKRLGKLCKTDGASAYLVYSRAIHALFQDLHNVSLEFAMHSQGVREQSKTKLSFQKEK